MVRELPHTCPSGELSKLTIGDDLSFAGYSALPSIKGKSKALSHGGFPKQEVTLPREFPRQEVGYLDELYTAVMPPFHGGVSQNSQVTLSDDEQVIEPTVMDDSKFKTSIILK